MCPAPILAAKRTDKVIGRTQTLTVSTNTRKGFKAEGAPEGRKWEKKPTGLQNKLESNKHNQRGTAAEKVITKCLVLLNT